MPIRFFIPLLAAALGTTAVAAAEQEPRYHLGFEFGFNFNLFNDDRFDGASTTFALVFPIRSGLTAGVLHERGNMAGEQDGAQADIDMALYGIRIGYAVWGNDAQEVSIFLGLGHAQYTGAFEQGAFVGDVGAKFAPFTGERGPIKGQLDIHASYRYAQINDEAGILTDDIDDLGGFQIGVGMGLFF